MDVPFADKACIFSGQRADEVANGVGKEGAEL